MGLPVFKEKVQNQHKGGLIQKQLQLQSRNEGQWKPVHTRDNAEAWRAGSGADLPDLRVVRGAANPGAALQLLQALLLFQVWGFCTSNKEVMHRVSFDIRTNTFLTFLYKETQLLWTSSKLVSQIPQPTRSFILNFLGTCMAPDDEMTLI